MEALGNCLSTCLPAMMAKISKLLFLSAPNKFFLQRHPFTTIEENLRHFLKSHSCKSHFPKDRKHYRMLRAVVLGKEQATCLCSLQQVCLHQVCPTGCGQEVRTQEGNTSGFMFAPDWTSCEVEWPGGFAFLSLWKHGLWPFPGNLERDLAGDHPPGQLLIKACFELTQKLWSWSHNFQDEHLEAPNEMKNHPCQILQILGSWFWDHGLSSENS